jgi:signal transduction histidine kinase
VVALHEDAAGTLWAGTGGGGLCRLSADRFRCFRAEDGMPSDNIYQILEDDRGALWMSSSRGVFRVAPKDVEAFLNGRAKSIASVIYDADDGLPTSSCEGESQPAGWKARDGRLYFPTSKGLAWVVPSRLDRLKNAAPPPVVIQAAIVDGQPAPAGDVTIEPGRQRLELQFAGLSFDAPARVRYRYKLDGYDPDWVDAHRQTSAHYTRLPPGRYVFRATASNKDGVWNPAGASIPISVRPHFYETRLFLVLLSVALAGLGLGVHALRMRLARREFSAILSERLRVARELHDNLEQELAALGVQILILKQQLAQGGEAAKPLAMISGILERCAAAVRAAVWDLRSGQDLVGALRAVAERLSTGQPIAVTVQVDGSPRALPDAVEKQLLRIGQEAVTNAVRHAAPRSIHIHLEVGRRVRLRVQDDGRGFDPSLSREGHFGLVGMRERVAQLGGRLDIVSRPGGGTEVTVDLAL